MDWNRGSDRIVGDEAADPVAGIVRWKASKSLWIGTMTLVALVFGPSTLTVGSMTLFVLATVLTLCAGHSVGMHRRLIHNSFDCPLWLEYVCVYLGTLVGMSGPFGLMRQHDLRDWAQRRASCHDYLRHGQSMLVDAWWQLHCDLRLANGPAFQLEPRLQHDRFYAWLERTWMLQQLPWMALFFALGGSSWVVWGICARVSVSVTGHWLVGHFAHRRGPMSWHVTDAGVQGRDVPIAAWVSMGESWHNNHHAFPGSARLGLREDQPDPGWLLIKLFERCGLAWAIKLPGNLPHRASLVSVSSPESVDDAGEMTRGVSSQT
jgi:stearoyl-CoA desaturase (delta-9 desaturase)